MNFPTVNKRFYLFILLPTLACHSFAQQAPLLLSAAIQNGLNSYQTIRAKQNYYNSSKELVLNTKNEYLPNVTVGIQDAYGTVNGQYGPLSIGSVAGVSSSGPSFANQSWNAAFGAQYVVNTNWEVFSFGRLKSRIEAFEARANTDSADVVQEQFVQGVRIADAYLNLLITQRLIANAQANLARVQYIQQVVLAKARNGLIAGVDSSIVNAQISSARIAILDAEAREQEQRNLLTRVLNTVQPQYDLQYNLDTIYFFKQIPSTFSDNFEVVENPQVQFYQSRVTQSDKYADYLQKSILPGVNLFGIFQTRGSGFENNYTPDYNERYSKSILKGINPTRTNYVAGVSIAWNIISVPKIRHQVNAQRFLSKGYAAETDLVSTQLKAQLALADQRIANTLQRFKEVPQQYKSASDAYIQKSVLYRNGLTDIVDLQQAIFALNKAETDVSVSYITVWQALLQKAAASGDFNLFLSQIR